MIIELNHILLEISKMQSVCVICKTNMLMMCEIDGTADVLQIKYFTVTWIKHNSSNAQTETQVRKIKTFSNKLAPSIGSFQSLCKFDGDGEFSLNSILWMKCAWITFMGCQGFWHRSGRICIIIVALTLVNKNRLSTNNPNKTFLYFSLGIRFFWKIVHNWFKHLHSSRR